jgi:cell division protein FtsQ
MALDWLKRLAGKKSDSEDTSPRRRRRGSMGTRKVDAGEQKPPFKLRISPRLVVALLVLVALGAGLFGAHRWLSRQPYFQVSRVMVVGNLHQVDRALVARRVEDLHQNFFNMNLERISAEVSGLPWVRTVTIHRLWPDGVEVDVEEQQPVAQWGDDALLNGQGEVFVGDSDGTLPRYNGPAGSGPEILREVARFNQELEPIHVKMMALNLSERRAWTLKLSDGSTVVLGRDNIHEHLKRYVTSYQQLFGNNPPTRGMVVDLRYNQGLAIRAWDQGKGK